MSRISRKQATLTLLAAALLLVASAAMAQNIPSGDDVWNTPGDGGTYLTLGNSDWQTICGATGGDVQIVLVGEDLPNQGDGDIVIHRNQNAVFDSSGNASITVTAAALSFKSTAAASTPCGNLTFKMGLDGGAQPSTTMDIHRTSSAGGSFDADLKIGAKVTAYSGSTAIGSVSKLGTLVNPQGGTPWAYAAPAGSLNPNGPWHPGVTTGGQQVTVTRTCAELLAQHAYKPPKKKCRVIVGPTQPYEPGPTQPYEPTQPGQYGQNYQGSTATHTDSSQLIAIPVEPCEATDTASASFDNP